MKKVMKARKGGFTLVELLIVIIIIAILAGMMLLTTGAATDGAEASKLVNNLRAMKSATLLFYIDNNLTWPPSGTNGQALADMVSPYMDRSIDILKYTPEILGVSGDARTYIGFNGGSIWTDKPGVMNKLSSMAGDAGLYEDASGTTYAGGNVVYMNLR